MAVATTLATTWAPRFLSVVRLVSGLLFMEHGTAKLLHFPPDPRFDHLELLSRLGAAGAIELVGGALVAVGLYTRCAAFVMSGEMAFAYFLSHATKGFYPVLNGGDGAILYCFLFFYLFLAGGGPWSLDRMLRGPRAG